ncbi:MAG: 1-acyl-sn-glycerol-3-phosphate acyltransferase [Saprospiraceae bacterium]|jgi:1-acyl-sn-glycerol-3-phosphate acyltransferase
MIKQIARFLLWLSGWKVDLTIPSESQRCVMIAAPHTSNWDFYYLRLAFWVLGIPMKVAIKNDWTKFPFGLVVKPLGGLGIDRSSKVTSERLSQADAMAAAFEGRDKIAMVIAAEGTRRKRDKWKMGYYWIAYKAQVPITCGYLDYEKKIAGVGPVVVYPSGEPGDELERIMDFYRDIKGRYPEQFQIDERYY